MFSQIFFALSTFNDVYLQCWKNYKECIKYIDRVLSFHFNNLSKVLFNCRIHGNVKEIVSKFYLWSLNLKFGC